MLEFGLEEMTRPVRSLMSHNGQMLPPLSFSRVLLWILTTGSLVSLTVLATAELVITAVKKFGSALEIIPLLLTFFELCIYVFYFSKKEKQLKNIIKSYNFFPGTCAAFLRSEKQMRKVVMQRSRRILLQFSGYVFLILVFYILVPFLPHGPDLSDFGFAPSDITQSIVNPLRKHPLYLPMWTPYNVETLQNGAYHIIIMWQGFTFAIAVSIFCGTDCLFYTFVIFMVEGMRHLKRVEPGSCNIKIKRKLRTQNTQHLQNISAWGLQFDNDYRIWVQQHQYLLNLSKEIGSFYSPIILITYLINGAVLCVLAYVLIKIRNMIGIICVLGHFSVIVIKLYIIATYGQELKDESLTVSTNSKIWTRLGTVKRTDARIISLRCNAAVTFTGFGYFDLTMELFGKVCSIALSYFIVLLQLH